MLNSKVIFRVDGSPQIGLGHLVRCIALAHMLRTHFQITFICKEIPEQIKKELSENEFPFEHIKEETIFLSQIKPQDIVVCDGYDFDISYQQQIKTKGAKLVCIDDLHNQIYVADLIINHAPGIKPDDYKAQYYTQYALGPEYALLRPAFLEQAKKERNINKIESVLICFGGSDYKNLTASTLKIVVGYNNFKKIIIVTGSAYNYLDSLNLLLKMDKRTVHYNSVGENQMLAIMLESDIAIIPASGLIFEVLASGCYVITGHYVDNQKAIYEGFKTLINITDAENFETLDILLRNLNNIIKLSNHIKVIDGLSGDRILQKFKVLQN